MNVLLIGSGGREHAIADAIYRSKNNSGLYSVMAYKNPGIAALSKEFLIAKEMNPKDEPAREQNNRKILEYAIQNNIGLAIIGPEDALDSGVQDMLWEFGIPAVGPRRAAAQIEINKAWTHDLMEKYRIAGLPKYKIFKKGDTGTDEYIDELKDVVIKPSGLTGGKGVKVMHDHFDIGGARIYAKEVLEKSDLIIEERLIGEEFTVQAFVDGESLAFAPAVQDHKRLKEGDEGPNTGGMGAYTDSGDLLPFMQESDYSEAKKTMADVVSAIKKETGIPYQGILYGQFMATAKGISVIEFNARFGDPEAMNVIPLLENDFLDVCIAIVTGKLGELNVSFKKQATVSKYAVPLGYPVSPEKGALITVGNPGLAQLYFASVEENNGEIQTKGSRAIASLGMAGTIEEAEEIAEEGLRAVVGNLFSRRDIGTNELVNKRVVHMKKLHVYGAENAEPVV